MIWKCFGTEEYSSVSVICNYCRFKKECKDVTPKLPKRIKDKKLKGKIKK